MRIPPLWGRNILSKNAMDRDSVPTTFVFYYTEQSGVYYSFTTIKKKTIVPSLPFSTLQSPEEKTPL